MRPAAATKDDTEKGTCPQMRQDRRNPEHECGAKRNGGVSDAPRVNYVFGRVPVHRTPIRRTTKPIRVRVR
jgi:hypothetical protein